MTTTHNDTQDTGHKLQEPRYPFPSVEEIEQAGLTLDAWNKALKLMARTFKAELDRGEAAADIRDEHFRTWQDYGKTDYDGYGAWAAIHHAQRLDTLTYEISDAAKLIDQQQPVLAKIGQELTQHRDRRVRLLGYTLISEMLVQTPEVLRLTVEGLRDELVAAVKAGDINE